MRPTLLYSAGCLFRLGWITLVIIAVLALTKQFVFDVMPVSGASMVPNFRNKDLIVLNKISYVIAKPKRGDSVVLRFPGDPNNEQYIKRLIGMPGEKVSIRDGKVYINDVLLNELYLSPQLKTDPKKEVVLKNNEYFLMGDNRPVSSDSRIWGTATSDNFIGKAVFILLPIKRLKPVTDPLYNQQ